MKNLPLRNNMQILDQIIMQSEQVYGPWAVVAGP